MLPQSAGNASVRCNLFQRAGSCSCCSLVSALINRGLYGSGMHRSDPSLSSPAEWGANEADMLSGNVSQEFALQWVDCRFRHADNDNTKLSPV